ncbi:MAG: bifunctional diguanylate cyclase/phosphodiesterase, partial [Pseudomonadota bacterium]
RLQELPYQDTTVARIGGDEFALLKRGTRDSEEIEKLAKSIVEIIEQPITLNGRRVHTGTSVGIALAPKHGRTARDLLDNADMAMYHAKATAGCQWSYFSANLRESALRAERLSEEIREGIARGQFVVYYQPQFSLTDGRIFGLEALVRWQHPREGLLLPGAFLSIAEERGLIVALSEVVIRQSIQDILRWRGGGLAVPRIAINIHQDQINDRNHLRWVERCYKDSAVDPGHLTFEITEGCILGRGNHHVPDLLQQWRDRGYGVSLDDFGTGFASLSHLKNLPVSEFKIDRSFIEDLLDDPPDRAIVDGLVKLSAELGTTLIAEGVETLEQAVMLRMMGAPYAQGYLFARPLPPARTDRLIEEKGVAVMHDRQAKAA